jgi:hypothetical protein
MIGQTRPGNYLFPMSLKIARWFHRKGLSRSKLKGGRVHRWLGDHLLSKHLWVFHRGPMARGWLIGCIICTSPFFGLHLITAVLLAMVFRANIPLTFFIQWSTNVFTVPVYYSLAYAFGCRLLGTKMIFVDGLGEGPGAPGSAFHFSSTLPGMHDYRSDPGNVRLRIDLPVLEEAAAAAKPR